MVFQFPALALTTLAAATPPDVEVVLTDENIEQIPERDDVDLVALSAMTPLAPRAYQIAAQYRAQSVPVVLGGVHATWCPDEAAQHVDCVVRGEGDWIWAQVIEDAQRGCLRARYEDRQWRPLDNIPAPRWDLLTGKKYFFTNTLQTSRGCPHDCDFCSVTTFYGHKLRVKPLPRVLVELEACTGGKGFLFIVDDNIIGRPDYALDLFHQLRNYRLKWLSHATIDIARDRQLLRACGASGCYGLFIGFETLSQQRLDAIGKRTNVANEYLDAARRIQDAGIGIEAAFIVGHDDDDLGVFERTVEFIERAKFDGVHLSVRTPYPGTRMYSELAAAGRIFDRDWQHYDLSQVVFKPAKMTADQLQEGFLWMWRQIYSYPSMLKRLLPPRRSLQVFGPMNVGLRQTCKKAGFFGPVLTTELSDAF